MFSNMYLIFCLLDLVYYFISSWTCHRFRFLIIDSRRLYIKSSNTKSYITESHMGVGGSKTSHNIKRHSFGRPIFIQIPQSYSLFIYLLFSSYLLNRHIVYSSLYLFLFSFQNPIIWLSLKCDVSKFQNRS